MKTSASTTWAAICLTAASFTAGCRPAENQNYYEALQTVGLSDYQDEIQVSEDIRAANPSNQNLLEQVVTAKKLLSLASTKIYETGWDEDSKIKEFLVRDLISANSTLKESILSDELGSSRILAERAYLLTVTVVDLLISDQLHRAELNIRPYNHGGNIHYLYEARNTMQLLEECLTRELPAAK